MGRAFFCLRLYHPARRMSIWRAARLEDGVPFRYNKTELTGGEAETVHRARTTAVYAAAHFLVDFTCALLVYRFVPGTGAVPESILIYNFCAFALQMPMGVITDRFGNGRAFSAAGCLLVAASAFLSGSPTALCLAAGVGNALFHIGGGTDVLNMSNSRAGMLGVFVSPGAFGLFTGALLSGYAVLQPVCMAALALTAAAILWLCPRVRAALPEEKEPPRRKALPLWLALLFAVVCIRSFSGFLFSFPWKNGIWSWVFIAGVVLGKTLGGILYDRFGGTGTALASLGAGAALFLLSGWPAAGCAAVLMFNMTMPVTLRAAADLLRNRKGFSFGLLTFALFVGFIPVWMELPWQGSSAVYAGMCILTAILLIPVLRRKEP